MSTWASVGDDAGWIAYDRWDDGEVDEDHRVFLDTAWSSASPCVRLICDYEWEYHAKNGEPYYQVVLSVEDARELARRLLRAAEAADS